MDNLTLAKIFENIASLLEIKGEVIFKTLAYRRAAESLRTLGEDIHTVAAQNRLQEIPGVGKAISEKIQELLTTGKLEFLQRLEEEVPASLLELLEVPDVGPKKAAMFWHEGEITSLAQLEAAAREGRIRNLPGMGEKSETRILAGIQSLAKRSTRLTLGYAWQVAQHWLGWLRAQPGVLHVEAAGSLRRWKTTIGDLDLVVASQSATAIMNAFVHHPEVGRILGQGANKSSVELTSGLKIQLWIQPPERFGTLWQYATGSKDHNVRLRELAQKRGLSLSEQALLKDGSDEEILCANEEEVYAALGLPWIAPELREDRGEIQAALKGSLPTLLRLEDLRSDLHMHSTWSDGVNTIEELARAAMARGLKCIAITDHSASLGVANGLTPVQLDEKQAEIRAVEANLGGKIRILSGTEVDIMADGSLAYPNEVLAKLDLVIASLHSSLRQSREVATPRVLAAMRNPHVDIIGHPSARLLPSRDGLDLDYEQVLAAAVETGTVLEINSNPMRLDLNEVQARRAAELGVLLSVNTDAHETGQLAQVEFGVSVARRAWVNPQKVINSWEVERLEAWLKDK